MNDALEMWGGVECSHVRVHTTVRDQLEETGHLNRIGDLDLIAGLGIQTLRYPVLWETVERTAGACDWTWTDARLQRIKELGIRPIAGLMHHGSGPSWSQILDPDFPELFARYAGLVAQRYPWIELYTPINEPLTTARISGLYGLWYPHGADEATCLRLTVAQCRATAVAMKAIRAHVPSAHLVQTEDVGRVFATERLAYQADHENERRWLALDLLAGRVDTRHPFHDRLLGAGIAKLHLAELQAEPCPPDIIGVDYYLTSDRMLDERIDRYPNEKAGGNGIDTYIDSAAARSMDRRDSGLFDRINEVWNRYHLPIVVTELHNGSTRDEQVRWLVEGWRSAQAARDYGVDVRAVTAWSLFGAVDWNSMLSAQDGYYESGAYDTRAGIPRPTAVAHAIADLVRTGRVDHPMLDRPGWWRDDRVLCERGSHLLLLGFGRMISAMQECCASRRLATRSAPPHVNRPSAINDQAWATIRVAPSDRAGSSATILCRFPDGGDLQLQYAQRCSAVEVANAVLDLVIDGQRGAFEILRTRPGNQYEVAPLPEANRSNGWYGFEETSDVA
ncbi:family 1 glycosylhydrolase [Mesorhizobium carmichaelinearum]|uniref:family 1 glycosylhydrolase n=1 Tax=Mesorhizobium carmichaelinearum TaxID=1208188 RepID=UPI00117EBDF0|nr:family 1 glycosylhydrolase [Mesorhizobium carmichaelinearum]